MSSSSSSPSPLLPPLVDEPWAGFGAGFNGLATILLLQPCGYSAEILVFGGQIISWKNERREELLFFSKKAVFGPNHPIRGGIPICFPRFLNNGNIEQQGYWSIDRSPRSATSPDKASIDLLRTIPRDDRIDWPHKFGFRLRFILESNGDLTMISTIQNRNVDGNPFTFQFSYRNYFPVSDISEVQIEGLKTLDYLDYLQNKEKFTEEADAITVESEVEKVYLSTPSTTITKVIDRQRERTYTIRRDDDSLPEIVVWNPWDKKAEQIADLDDTEYKQMVCVEAAAVENAITLNPGEVWVGTQRLSVHPST